MIFSKMDLNGTSDVNLQTGETLASLLILTFEVIGFILLGLGVIGMYKGIEIAHPVYSVLFLNICFNFVMTLPNLASIIFVPLYTWVRVTIYSNCFGMLFHHSRFALEKFQLHNVMILLTKIVFLLKEVYCHFYWCTSTVK